MGRTGSEILFLYLGTISNHSIIPVCLTHVQTISTRGRVMCHVSHQGGNAIQQDSQPIELNLRFSRKPWWFKPPFVDVWCRTLLAKLIRNTTWQFGLNSPNFLVNNLVTFWYINIIIIFLNRRGLWAFVTCVVTCVYAIRICGIFIIYVSLNVTNVLTGSFVDKPRIKLRLSASWTTEITCSVRATIQIVIQIADIFLDLQFRRISYEINISNSIKLVWRAVIWI